ncbi:MAG: peptide ABC transporter ATP-binding protein [Paenibacillaceae bacterium ZCTH02-B3]|nr:MAG: peptide ABC transporter ATP-binding protein [Paenibacillaceae bacterium ZCTH02-B3]
MNPLLEVKDLKVYFHTDQGLVKSVDGIRFSIGRGESVALVGESGCGKSVTSLTIMRLVPTPPGEIVQGEVLFEGKNLLELPEKEMTKHRGNQISMIFQEPMTSLNPLIKIGDQIGEVLQIHKKAGRKEAFRKSVELLGEAGISRPEEVAQSYPHQLSGGMRQRVMIAMAIACGPKLLIADEPTTALDVTIQAQILDLIRRLKDELNMSLLMISHDLGVVADMCERVMVMYAGKIVEEADVRELFRNPKHPYTAGLMRSIPQLDQETKRLYSIPGNVPTPKDMPRGCAFAPRCEHASARCFEEAPPLAPVGRGHLAACWMNQ